MHFFSTTPATMQPQQALSLQHGHHGNGSHDNNNCSLQLLLPPTIAGKNKQTKTIQKSLYTMVFK